MEHVLCCIVKEGHCHRPQRQEHHPVDDLDGIAVVDAMTLLTFSLLPPHQQMFYVGWLFDNTVPKTQK
jgi:hypothetical protein